MANASFNSLPNRLTTDSLTPDVEDGKYFIPLLAPRSSYIALINSASVTVVAVLPVRAKALCTIVFAPPAPCCTDVLHTASCTPLLHDLSHISIPVEDLILLTAGS